MACLASGDIEGSILEVQRVAKLGFKGLSLPCKPVWGAPDHEALNYNLPEFDPLWAAIQDADLPITFHVSTGRDPRTARGNGGAVINYACHSLAPTMEPIVNLCASGVLERFTRLSFGSIEAGIGWVPWALTAMDEVSSTASQVRPKLKALPATAKARGLRVSAKTPGLDLARSHGLTDNFMWANDYPHHEGTWPHSAAAIERTMGDLTDEERAKILGLNAARVFKFDVPKRYQQARNAATGSL
jgi:predicted TIM-barrel fold metal-dependent hydrolase